MKKIFIFRSMEWIETGPGQLDCPIINFGTYKIRIGTVATNKPVKLVIPGMITAKQFTHLDDAKSYAQQHFEESFSHMLSRLPESTDILHFIDRFGNWSVRTFGPDYHPNRIIEHIRRELLEIERSPNDLSEWIDVVLLALDGARRAGHKASEILRGLWLKQIKNEHREWPDWRKQDLDKPIHHKRDKVKIETVAYIGRSMYSEKGIWDDAIGGFKNMANIWKNAGDESEWSEDDYPPLKVHVTIEEI